MLRQQPINPGDSNRLTATPQPRSIQGKCFDDLVNDAGRMSRGFKQMKLCHPELKVSRFQRWRRRRLATPRHRHVKLLGPSLYPKPTATNQLPGLIDQGEQLIRDNGRSQIGYLPLWPVTDLVQR